MIYTKYILSLINYLQFLIVWILDLNKIDENEKTNQKKLWSIFLDKYLFGGTNKQ